MAQSHDHTDDATLANRRIRKFREHRDAPLTLQAVMLQYREFRDGKRPVAEKQVGSWGFIELEKAAELSDVVRGDIPETDGVPLMYIGQPGPKNYYTSHNAENIDVDALEWLEDSKYTLIGNVDGGWHNWGGRPEFSTNGIDFGDAKTVDVRSIIDARRNDD